MKSKANKRPLQIVVQDGQPSAVILDMQDYIEMLERLEDLEDLEMLNEMRQRPLEFRKIEDFLEEYS
jgi:PHD/YefM family antitoxin component YafN of YafNO toxin-antitoxin module